MDRTNATDETPHIFSSYYIKPQRPFCKGTAALLLSIYSFFLFHTINTIKISEIKNTSFYKHDSTLQTGSEDLWSNKNGQNHVKDLALSPGELPGYTGWARPEYTLVGHFTVKSSSGRRIKVGQNWIVQIQCKHEKCSLGGAHFYVRAYGPSVITGQVKDNKDGSYEITFLPLDPGQYFIEVVLAFSNTPSWNAFPLSANETEPGYEGYLLPDFPMQIKVYSPPKKHRQYYYDNDSPVAGRFCTFEELIENSSSSAYGKGRWVVTDKVRNKSHRDMTPHEHSVTLRGYQNSWNSLGVRMEYFPTTCSLLSSGQTKNDKTREIVDRCLYNGNSKGSTPSVYDLHVIFIGDSVMGLQHRAFETFLNRATSNSKQHIKTTMICTHGGIVRRIDEIKSTLREIQLSSITMRRLILFNTGLHDIAQLCSQKYSTERTEYLQTTDSHLDCGELYRITFHELVNFLNMYPAELKVFQSTTAGWLRYGNFGFAWPSTSAQPFSLSPNFVSHFNDIAFDELTSLNNTEGYKDNIYITDGYWLTLPRPDHREVNEANDIGKHLVHPGPEVIDVLSRRWLMLILRKLCGDTLW